MSILLGFPAPANRPLARENARRLAAALHSVVKPSRRIVLGEPHSPFRVPCHSQDFWFTALVSDRTYTLRGTHKRYQAARSGPNFGVNFKHPWRTMLTTHRLDNLSRELGCDVFAAEWQPPDAADSVLLHPEVRDVFGRLDLGSMRLFYLCPVQLLIEAEFADIERCAAQVRLGRQLLLTIAGLQAGTA